MQKDTRRGTLTLGFKKKDVGISYTDTTREMLAERQRINREIQAKKSVQNSKKPFAKVDASAVVKSAESEVSEQQKVVANTSRDDKIKDDSDKSGNDFKDRNGEIKNKDDGGNKGYNRANRDGSGENVYKKEVDGNREGNDNRYNRGDNGNRYEKNGNRDNGGVNKDGRYNKDNSGNRYNRDGDKDSGYSRYKPNREGDGNRENRYNKDNNDNNRYNKDNNGNNRYNKDGNGKNVYNRDSNVNNRYNKDGGGNNRYNKDSSGNNVYNRDGNGKNVYNRDSGGKNVYNRDSSGNNVYNRDGNGKNVYNRDSSGNNVYNRDGNGNNRYNKDGGNRYNNSGGNRYNGYNKNNRNNDNKNNKDAGDNRDIKKTEVKVEEKDRNDKNFLSTSNSQINKKPFNRDFKPKSKNNTFEEESNLDKLNRKISKDKSDKYSKNIHTFVFNGEDDGSSELRYNFTKNKKKNKKNEQIDQPPQKTIKIINIPDFISVADLSDRMNEKKANIIKKLLTMGIKVTANQILDAETAELVVMELGHSPNRVSDSDIENVLTENIGTKFISRSPVVTVMGHVDHGKTSLLDAIRFTKIAERESGGITQHIGASRIEHGDGKFITFIDTPGHEAFTEMRMRGANITDIVILVVAADDSVKNQTIEAINHTKVAKVPIIVAINKIDKENANPEKVKQELLSYDVVSEDFGGEVMCVNVSAKEKINIDKLMETIFLQADMLDLKSPIDCKAVGVVIESKIDQKRGVLTTVLVQKGILNVGDIILAGASYGKVKKMVDDKGKNQNCAEPSMAVEILGFNISPSAGDIFNVVSTDKEARDIIVYRERKIRETKETKRSKTAESLLQEVKGSNKKQLSVVLKCDVSGSIEAITGSLAKLNGDEVIVNVIHSAIGAITETDVNLASASNAIIVAFNVRGSGAIKDLAKEKDVEIKYYSIIYNIIDDVKILMSGLLKPIEKEKIIGQAEVRNVIKISGIGNIAGCYVTDGEIRRNLSIRLIRDGIVIFTGKIKTLKRFKEDVREIKNNYECGISIENYDDIKEKDVIECFEITEQKREL
jgi:translation initiation factor IF-2